MALGALGIGALISGGSALLQSIIGGVQAAKGAKGFKKTMAGRPDYEIPSEYKDILARYQQAQARDMPGYGQLVSQVGQTGARARGAAERGAISSTAYGSQVGDIYQKELDALQNLGVQQEQYKTLMGDKVTGAQLGFAGQKEQKQNWDELLKWQTEANLFGEQKPAGIQNLFAGIQSGAGSMMDFLGTKYMTDMMKGLQPSEVGTQPPRNPYLDLLNINKPLSG